MAGKISLQQVLQVTNSTTMSVAKSSSLDQTGDGLWSEVVAIATSDTQITPGVSSPGIYMVENLDAANPVDIGMYDGATARYVDTILAGETRGPCRLKSGVTLVLKASTASVNVRVTMAET